MAFVGHLAGDACCRLFAVSKQQAFVAAAATSAAAVSKSVNHKSTNTNVGRDYYALFVVRVIYLICISLIIRCLEQASMQPSIAEREQRDAAPFLRKTLLDVLLYATYNFVYLRTKEP